MAGIQIRNEKGQQRYARYWNENSSATRTYKGLVFIVHDYCEHCLVYTEIAKSLTRQGYFVFLHDHIGHGQSEGVRAHVSSFNDYVKDLFHHIDQVKNKFPDSPVFLLGHSMGGTVAILAAMSRPKFFSGVVLIGPLVTPDRKAATPFRICICKMVAKVLPQMHILKPDPTLVSRDERYVKAYASDPLVYHSGMKCRWALAFLDALKLIEHGMSEIEWPFFILHGGEDGYCEVAGSELLYAKAKSTDKKPKIFDRAFHLLLHELDPVKKETFDLIIDWLNIRDGTDYTRL